MKQKVFTLLTLLLFAVTSSWAQSESVTPSTPSEGTVNGNYVKFTGTFTHGSKRWTLAKEEGSGGGYITITPKAGLVLTKVVFQWRQNSNMDIDHTDFSTGDHSESGLVTTWTSTGGASSLTITNNSTTKDIVMATGKSSGGTIDITVCVSNTIASSGYSTFCSNYPIDLANLPAGLTAYKVEDANVSASSVSLTEVNVAAAANTPLILAGTGGTTYNIPVAATGSAVSDNVLVQGPGSAVSYEAGKTKYVLQGGIFKKIVDGTPATIPATKAYLEVNRVVAANELFFDFGNTTDIKSVSKSQNMSYGEFYNLAGQRVAQPSKGLYIVNGKKVVIK